MITPESFKPLFFPKGQTKGIMVFVICLMLGGVFALVYKTGGTYLAYLHLLYIPIVLAGLIFPIWGGILTGLVAGFLVGPAMPANIEMAISQPYSSWILRTAVFATVGGLAGLAASLFHTYLRELELKRTTDHLTGLYNLNGLKQWHLDYLHIHRPTSMIMIVAELNHMGKIERALGTDGTSKLIHYISRQLQGALGDKAIIGHFQTNRFAIIVPHQEDMESVLKHCEVLGTHAYAIDGIPLLIEMRFGLSLYPYDDHDLHQLLRKARIALDEGLKDGKRFKHYDKVSDQNPQRNLLILNRLAEALQSKSLQLFYQPKIAMGSKKTIGVEALIRWEDPILGVVSPHEFIPLVEETQLIHPLTKWIMEEALGQMRKWHDAGYPISVAVNFSMKNFSDPGTLALLDDLLAHYRIPKKKFEIEVTETSVAPNIQAIAQTLTHLHAKGIRIAIDDFGTGQSTQQYLYEFPLDVIKIDQLFIRDMTTNPAAAAIVRSAITLGHELHLEVIAEGIETQDQFDLIRLWGCDVGQGHYIARAMSAADLSEWLKLHGIKGKPATS